MSYLKVDQRFHFKKHKKLQKKCEEKDAFDVAVDGSLGNIIKGTPLKLKFDFLRALYILYQAEQTELLTFSNQIQKQTFTGVYSRLQRKAYS